MARRLILLSLILTAVNSFADEPSVSLAFNNVRLQTVTFAIARQTHSTQPMYRIGMTKEMRNVEGITINVQDVPLSKAFDVLKKRYGICAWATDLQPGDLVAVIVSYCNARPFREDQSDRYRLL